jgi:hypothetical protein
MWLNVKYSMVEEALKLDSDIQNCQCALAEAPTGTPAG